MKICSLITIQRYFGFQEIFMVDGFAVKSFYAIADIIPNIIVFLNNSSSSIEKYIHLVGFL